MRDSEKNLTHLQRVLLFKDSSVELFRLFRPVPLAPLRHRSIARSLWQYSRPGVAVVFGEREGPKRFLGNFERILQSDGYGA